MRYLILILSLLLAACADNNSRYSQTNDEAPESVPDLSHIEDAQPRYEPYSLQGNRDYTVNGQRYQVVKTPGEFAQKGIASWYGKKFHGHLTSNGEVYDMFSMTAAHKTLPLPSYVEVTNLDNGKKAIVRVNDRGPFHEGRIIDLSYAAATKLGVVATGVANVEIHLLHPEKPQDPKEWQTNRSEAFFVQLAALSDEAKARRTAAELGKSLNLPTDIVKKGDVWRLRFGPYQDQDSARAALDVAKRNKFTGAFIVTEKISTEQTDKTVVTN